MLILQTSPFLITALIGFGILACSDLRHRAAALAISTEECVDPRSYPAHVLTDCRIVCNSGRSSRTLSGATVRFRGSAGVQSFLVLSG